MNKTKKTNFKLICLFLFILLITSFILSTNVNAQTGNPNVYEANDTDLINKILGVGVTISNLSITGNTSQRGIFENTESIFSFSDGIALTTGNITSMFADHSSTASKSYGSAGDDDLKSLTTSGITNDAIIVEFDTISTTDKLSFEYVFASEEFNQSPQYNDVLGLFINGKNIAYLPNSVTPITIQNLKGTPYHIENTSLINFAFLGYTTTLYCEADVTPGQTVHIKIAIADTTDTQMDSAVFIRSGSLKYAPADKNEPKTGDSIYINHSFIVFGILFIVVILFAITKVRPFFCK